MFFFKDIFRFGLSEPVKSWLPEEKFDVSLKVFMDYALMVAGPSFTVGVAEEERDTVSVTEMADAPECTHKMAATATGHIITAIHESGKVTASHCDSNEVSADLPESRHVSTDLPESRHVSAVHPESLHVSSVHPKSIHVSAVRPVSSHLSSAASHHSWSSRVMPRHSWSSRDLSRTVRHTQIFKASASSSQSGVQCEECTTGVCTRSWHPQTHLH